MKLYNVSFNLNNLSDSMIPMIPDSAGDDENKTIPRVCLCDTIEHCMQAIASCNRNLEKGAYFILREVEINLSDKALVKPDYLKQTGYVPDALENNEYWYLKPLKAKVTKHVVISFNYEFELAYSCISREQILTIISKYMRAKRFERYKTSKGIHNAFGRYCNEHQLWSETDAVWEDLAMLPWAQKTGIYGLKHKEIKIRPVH